MRSCDGCSLTVRAWFAHVTTSSHHFIYKQQLLAQDWSDVQELFFDDVVVPDVGFSGREGLTCQSINTEGLSTIEVGILDFDQGLLWVEA